MAIKFWDDINKCCKMKPQNTEIRRDYNIGQAILVTDGEW